MRGLFDILSIAFFILYYLCTQYSLGNKIEKNEMGGACSAYWGDGRRKQAFGGET
jgi:hypothetical protein